MTQEKPNAIPDWEKIIWEQTPYTGVSIYKVKEKLNPSDPDIPLYSIFALKIEPRRIIPLHRHNRKLGWTETITFPIGGKFETGNEQGFKPVDAKNQSEIVIHAHEIFGLKNIDPLQPLYFLSKMEPGFKGYAEIEEIKTK